MSQPVRPAPPAGSSFTGVVALDGPSGTGKSTVARRLATALNARYLDTGAMYRAATLAVLRARIPVDDALAVAATVSAADIRVGTDPAAPSVTLRGEAVDREIRSAEVTASVSAVSAVPAVREHLVRHQRHLIDGGGIVVEGRDIATVVWPDARPKIYLTASPEVRAQRRAAELGDGVDVASVAADIARRDGLDSSRATSPLAQAVDAVEVDTTDLSIDEVVQQLVALTGQPADA